MITPEHAKDFANTFRKDSHASRIDEAKVREIVLELMRQLNCPEVLIQVKEWDRRRGFTVHILERSDIHLAETSEDGVRQELIRKLSALKNTPSYWAKRT